MITATFYGSFLDVVLPQTDPHGQLRRVAWLAERLQAYSAARPLKRWWLRLKYRWQGPDLIRDPM